MAIDVAAFSESDVRKAYKFLNHTEETELRLIDPARKLPVKSIFVHSEDKFVEVCKQYNGKYQIYAGIHERKPDGTKAEDVISVQTICVDVDAIRTDMSLPATETELKCAEKVADNILQKYPSGCKIMSGNGYQLWYAIPKLKITDENRDWFEEHLQLWFEQLDDDFSTPEANIDHIGDLPRVIKVCGTLSIKGQNTFERPHRRSYAIKDLIRQQDASILDEISTLKVPEKPQVIAKPISEIKSEEIQKYIENDDKARRLYSGDLSGYKSRSEAELALVTKLVWFGADDSQIDVILSQSGIGKWSVAHKRYREITLQKARTQTTPRDVSTKNVPRAKPKFKTFTAADLKNMESQPVNWLITDLIPDGSITILAGKRSSFKSFGALLIALCCAYNQKFLNTFDTQQAKVLFLDEENGKPILKTRVQQLAKGLGLEKFDDNLLFTSFEAIKIDKLEYRTQLEDVIMQFKPKIIIVDSFRRIITSEENDAGAISDFFTSIIRPFSEKYGLTWIFLHHLRKGMAGRVSDEMDELRGSSDLANLADVILIFQRLKGEATKFILKQVKCRYASEIPAKLVQLNFTDDNLQMICCGDAQETLFADQLCCDLILKWLSETQKTSFLTKEVKEAMALQKQSSRTIQRALDLLQSGDEPKIRKIKRGVYEINAIKDESPKAAGELNDK